MAGCSGGRRLPAASPEPGSAVPTLGASNVTRGNGGTTLKKYLVGIDGSETAATAAARAGEMAAATGGSIHVVCAYARGETSTITSGSDSFVVSDLDRAQQIAEQQAARYRSQGIDSTAAALQQKPAAALLAEAERIGADVIVVGSRRMQGIGRILGAVANDVAHNAPCDVLIVKTT